MFCNIIHYMIQKLGVNIYIFFFFGGGGGGVIIEINTFI